MEARACPAEYKAVQKAFIDNVPVEFGRVAYDGDVCLLRMIHKWLHTGLESDSAQLELEEVGDLMIEENVGFSEWWLTRHDAMEED
jgi:hypothetical protein